MITYQPIEQARNTLGNSKPENTIAKKQKTTPTESRAHGGNLLQAMPGSKPTLSPTSLATPKIVICRWLKPNTDFSEGEYSGKL